DITDDINATIARSHLLDGLAVVQTRHTTSGILINEHEPLLLEDLAAMFERLVPSQLECAHDDLRRRTVTIGPGERKNGVAHCRAALLRTSESLVVQNGALALGRWQRVFFVEFDGGQERQVSLMLANL